MCGQANGLLVSFGGHSLKVDSDSPQITSAMQAHLRHCHVDEQRGDLITEFFITGTDKSTFLISENGNVLFPALGMSYDFTLQMLMTELISRLVAVSNMGMVLHGAALTWQENGLVLCGKSSSGKSSLAAWLIAKGFHYLTDEIIEVPLNGEHIYGLPRSIFLKSGSAFIWQFHLPDTNVPGFLSFEDGGAWIDPHLFHPGGVTDKVRPSVLIFPQYRVKAPLQTQKLTTAEALFQLMQTLVNARNLPGHGMDAATRLVRQVRAYTLTYSDIEAATNWIKQTLTI